MRWKKLLGIVLVVVGCLSIGGGYYIDAQVLEGEEKVSSAERKVDQGKRIFSLSPSTEALSEGVFGGADRKIQDAKDEIAYYAALAGQLKVGGVVLLVVGAAFLWVSRRR